MSGWPHRHRWAVTGASPSEVIRDGSTSLTEPSTWVLRACADCSATKSERIRGAFTLEQLTGQPDSPRP